MGDCLQSLWGTGYLLGRPGFISREVVELGGHPITKLIIVILINFFLIPDLMRRSTVGANTQEWMTIRFKTRSGLPGKS